MAGDAGGGARLIAALAKIPPSVWVLGCRVDALDTAGAVDRIANLVRGGARAQVVTFGAEMAMLARRDERYRAVINRAAVVVADTVGVAFASRLLGGGARGRVPGIDLCERLCDVCARENFPVFLLGGAEGVAKQAAAALQSRHRALKIAGAHHGYFQPDSQAQVAAGIGASGARLVFVGLGFPKQEFFIADNLARLGAVCIGVGGAFDVWTGRLRRAPQMMRSLGLEWLYRLAREPRRLRRQLVLPQFALLVAGQALRARVVKVRKA